MVGRTQRRLEASMTAKQSERRVRPMQIADFTEEKCKKRQSGILKSSRSPLRTLKETDINQKMEPVSKLRRSSRRVSFADTKEVKEFVTDKMIIQDDMENDETICMLECRQNIEIHNSRTSSQKENQQLELERDVITQKNLITGMDALLHAPLRTPLQQLEPCKPIETVSEHQIFPISGLEVQRESKETTPTSEFQKKIDFKSFLAGLDSRKPAYKNSSNDKEEKVLSSVEQNVAPEHQKTINFKSFLNSIKSTEADENKMIMPSIYEEQKFKQGDMGVTSNCETNNLVLQNHTINSLDANKTILFLEHDNDMEITKSHTFSINHFVMEKCDEFHSVKESNNSAKLGNKGTLDSSLPQCKALVLSGADHIAVTGSVTVPINVKTDHQTNQDQPTVATANINERSLLPSCIHGELTVTGYESSKKIEKSKAQDTTKLTSRSLGIHQENLTKTQMFSNENDMDITKSHTVSIDSGMFGQVSNCKVDSNASFIHDKTMVFSEANDMDITQSNTVTIVSDDPQQISNKALQSTRKSFSFCTPGSKMASLPNENTVMFSEANDMDITKSHTVAIESDSLDQISNKVLQSTKKNFSLFTAGSKMASLPNENTVMFSEANDMDITKSHTVAIESGSLDQISNKVLQSTKKNFSLFTAGSKMASLPNENTVMFSEANDMDITKSHTVAIESGSIGRVPDCTVGSNIPFASDRTVVFSEANDMDITQSHTVAIESDNLGQISNKALQSTRKSSRLSNLGSIVALLPNEKTVVFSEANEMDITKSHTVTIDSGSIGRVPDCTAGSNIPFASDRTVVFSEANDMDITQSHTIAIERDNLGQISNKVLQSTVKGSSLFTAGMKMASLPNENIVFSEANEMDITKSHTVTIDSGSIGRVPDCTVGSNTPFASDRTVVFSEANDMDITQSHTVAIESDNLGQISNKALQSTRKSSRLSNLGSIVALLPNEKTVVFSEANEMDITKSHTVTIDSGSIGRVPDCTVGSNIPFASDRTVVFSEANDMDITQSHTGAIERDNLGQISNKVLQSTVKGSSLFTAGMKMASLPNESIVFSEANEMDITKSHTVTIDSGSIGRVPDCTVGSSASLGSDRTVVFSEANDMDITQSHTGAIESDNLGQISNKALQSTRKSSRLSNLGSIVALLPNEKTVVFSEANEMDITKSHTVTIDSGSIGRVPDCTAGSNIPFASDRTVVFSEANDMDITQSHTIAIERDNLGQISNKVLQSTVKGSSLFTAGMKMASLPNENIVFSEANEMDITKSHTVTIDSGSIGRVPDCTVGSNIPFASDRTVVFSEANDMDITQSHTGAIESDNLGQISNKTLQSTRKSSRLSNLGSIVALLPNEKTVVFSEANEMDITKSHTVTIDSGSIGRVPDCTVGSNTPFASDRTVVFSKANDMDITQSHTVAIESDNLGQISNKTLQSTRKSSRLSNLGSIVALLPNEKTVVFSEASDMDITKSHTVTIDSGSIGRVPDCTVGSNTPFARDRTVVFSKANDMDITQSHTVAIESDNLGQISNKTLQSTRKSSRLSNLGSIVALLPNEKTVVFSEANEMDITKSHTVTIDSGSIGRVPDCTVGSSASLGSDRSMVFSEANDRDITKSHTVAIENGNLKMNDNQTFGYQKMTFSHSNTLACLPNSRSSIFLQLNDKDINPSSVAVVDSMNFEAIVNCAVSSNSSFPGGDTVVVSEPNDMDMTRSQTVATEGGCLCSASFFPSDRTAIFSEANDMAVTKSYTTNIDSESCEAISNGALCSANITSDLNAVGCVLSSCSSTNSVVSEQAADVKEKDIVLIHGRHNECGKHKVTQLKLVTEQQQFSNQMDHASSSTQRNLEANSKCITGPREKGNLKGVELCIDSSFDATPTHKSDPEVQKRAIIDQTREADSDEFVQSQVTKGTAQGTRTESVSTTSNNLECNASIKSNISNVSCLQKMNSKPDVTPDPPVEKSPMDGNNPVDCQTFDAKTCLPKQSSFVKDTLASQISLGAFLPKLPSRSNLCRAVHSSHQNVVKPSVEYHCSDSLLNTTGKSEGPESSKIFEPSGNSQEQSDGQHKMQVNDCHEVESRMLDFVNPSLCLKSSEGCSIREQQYRETFSAPEQGINATDQVLLCSKISTVEQRPCQKRVWSEGENGNAYNKRKLLECKDTDASRKEVKITPVVQWEGVGHETVEENLLSLITKSLDNNSSLDSTKGDGTAADAITPKCNLNASLVILEESELHKKLMDGEITVREFFKFLKVQTRPQKSRQSELQVNPELDRSSGLENWLAVKFIHRPKREVYEDNTSALSAAINDLKDQLLDLDKLLSEVNFPLLKEVMQMTKEELQQFRSCLNTKKSTYVKKTKVICHDQKVQLYLTQLNALKAQHQQRKEYEDSLDDILNKMDDCLASLDLANLDHLGECNMDVFDSCEGLMQLKQIVNNKNEDLKNLQGERCKVESQLAKVRDEKLMQEKAVNMLELNEEFQELLEWTLVTCQGDQAVYRFLYDSLELTLQYGEPECAELSPGEKYRKIIDIKLVSELDEKESPAHSKLVHDLVMMCWKNRESWHSKHSNESQVPMDSSPTLQFVTEGKTENRHHSGLISLLLDLSLVVSRCRLLGDELEYLLNWGSKFDILKLEIQHTDVKFLVSSYEALSKFEVVFHIMPGYPWLPLQFTFNSWFGNISAEHIKEVLMTVKPGHKYLIRIMKSLFLTLLIRPGANRFQL